MAEHSIPEAQKPGESLPEDINEESSFNLTDAEQRIQRILLLYSEGKIIQVSLRYNL